MPISSPGYNGPKEKKYLFIDGGCLRRIMQNFSDKFLDGRELELNYRYVKSSYSKVFYYDAVHVKRQEESDADYEVRIQPRISELQAIRMLDGYHVYEGDVRRRRKRGNEQKKVDVMIAVDMLMHSFRKNMHQASLLTNDLDFKPLIDALVQDGMNVELIYENGWVNDELVSAADKKTPLLPTRISHWITNLTQEERLYYLPQNSSTISYSPDEVLLKWLDENNVPRMISVQQNIFHFHRSTSGSSSPNGYKHSNLDVLKSWVEAVEQIKIPEVD